MVCALKNQAPTPIYKEKNDSLSAVIGKAKHRSPRGGSLLDSYLAFRLQCFLIWVFLETKKSAKIFRPQKKKRAAREERGGVGGTNQLAAVFSYRRLVETPIASELLAAGHC